MEVIMLPLLALAFATPEPSFPCGPITFVSEMATKGELHAEQRVCLDRTARGDGPFRLTASQFLIEDASRRGRRGTWKALTERHLEEIDPEDPVLLLAYARFLFVSDRSEDSIAFMEHAMPLVERWNDDPEAMVSLHRMRTVAAVQLWQAGKSDKARAHEYAASWWATSEDLGIPDPTAHSLCVTTGDPIDCGDLPSVADAALAKN